MLSQVLDTGLLKLVFQAVNLASIADNTASSPLTNIYISLHNASPGAGGTQTTNETAYTNYARVAVVRTSAGWTVAGSDPTTNASNAAVINFPQCGATGDTLTHWAAGYLSSGAGSIIAYGPIGAGPPLDFTNTSASPGSLTAPGSGYALNQRVCLFADPASKGGGLAAGLTAGTEYFVGTVAGDSFTLSTTTGNANPVNTSATGSGIAIGSSPLIVNNNITPTIAIGALIVYLS